MFIINILLVLIIIFEHYYRIIVALIASIGIIKSLVIIIVNKKLEVQFIFRIANYWESKQRLNFNYYC